LLDYDNSRRAYDSLVTAKKPDHTKTSKVCICTVSQWATTMTGSER